MTSLNPYFTGLSILIYHQDWGCPVGGGLNPYFTGLSILIRRRCIIMNLTKESQSLFYWIIYSYELENCQRRDMTLTVSILILLDYLFLSCILNTYPIEEEDVSILILLDYLFLSLEGICPRKLPRSSQSLFYWIIYSYR